MVEAQTPREVHSHPFDLDTDLWAHPWKATTVGGSFHWTLGHGTIFKMEGNQ